MKPTASSHVTETFESDGRSTRKDVPHRDRFLCSLTLVLTLLSAWMPTQAAGTAPSDAELVQARQWSAAKWEEPAPAVASSGFSAEPPFSFIYGDRPSASLLGSWRVERTAHGQ